MVSVAELFELMSDVIVLVVAKLCSIGRLKKTRSRVTSFNTSDRRQSCCSVNVTRVASATSVAPSAHDAPSLARRALRPESKSSVRIVTPTGVTIGDTSQATIGNDAIRELRTETRQKPATDKT